MPDVIYYAACSLDGYIATADGGVGWLEPFQAGGQDYGFAEFYSSIEALVMGSRTYEFALEHGPWQAPDKPSWVFSLRLIEVKPLPNGLVQLSYQPNAETDEPGPT